MSSTRLSSDDDQGGGLGCLIVGVAAPVLPVILFLLIAWPHDKLGVTYLSTSNPPRRALHRRSWRDCRSVGEWLT